VYHKANGRRFLHAVAISRRPKAGMSREGVQIKATTSLRKSSAQFDVPADIVHCCARSTIRSSFTFDDSANLRKLRGDREGLFFTREIRIPR